MPEGIGLEGIMDMDQFLRGMNQYIRANRAMDQQTVKASSSMTNAFQKVGQIASGIITAQLIAGIGREVKSLVMDARAIPGVASAFEGLGGSIERMRAGALGMVTDVELMKSFNLAAGLVTKDFAQKLPDAMQYLAKVSAATGTSMTFMVDSLVKGVGRMSPMILDNLGIQVSLAEATEKAADMYGVQADALDKGQKQAGMMAVVMEKLRENTAAMPEVVGSAAHEMASLNTIVANLKNELGTALIPVFSELLRAITPVAQQFGEALRTEEFRQGVAMATDAVRDMIRFFQDLHPETVNMVEDLGKVAVAVGGVGIAFTLLSGPAGPIILAVTAVVGLLKAIDELNKRTEEIRQSWEAQVSGVRETVQTYDEYIVAVAKLDGRFRELTTAEAIASAKNLLLREGLIETEAQFNVLSGAVQLSNRYMDEGAYAAKLLADEMAYGTGVAAESVQSYDDMEGAIISLRLGLEETAQQFPAFADEMSSTATKVLSSHDQMTERIQSFVDDVTNGYHRMAEETDQAISEAFRSDKMARLLATQAATLGRHLLQMEQMEDQHGRTMADIQFRYDMQRNEESARYQQKRQGLMEAGKTEEAALLDAKFANQQIASEQQYSRDQLLQERNYILQRVQQKKAYLLQLSDMRDQTLRMLMETIKAQVAEAGEITKYQAWKLTEIAKAGSNILQIETGTYVARLQAQKEFGTGVIEIEDQIANATAAIRAGEKEAEEAIAGLEAELARLQAQLTTAYELPPLDTTAFQDSAREAAKPVERAMTKLVDDITKGMESILEFEETLERMMKLQEKFVAAEVPDITRWTTRFEGVMRQVVASIRRVLYLFEAEEAETLAKLASDMAKMYEAVIRDFSDIKEYELPDMVDWQNQILLISETIINVLRALAETYSSEGLVDAKGWASSVEEIVGVIGPAIDALEDLAEYEPLSGLEAKWLNAQHWLNAVVRNLIWLASTYEIEGVRNAGEFAEHARKIMELVEITVDALNALAEYEPLHGLEEKWLSVQHWLYRIIENVKYLASLYELEGIQNVAKFADAAKTIVGLIQPTIDSLEALAEYEPLHSLEAKWLSAQHWLYRIIENVKYLASLYELEGIENVGRFATSAGQIINIIQPTVDALNALAEYEPLHGLEEKWLSAQHWLWKVVNAIEYLAGLYDLTGIQETAKFATAVGTIVGLVEPAISALNALAEYEHDLQLGLKIQTFREDLDMLIWEMASLARAYEGEGVEASKGFFEAVGTITETTKSGVDALLALADYSPVAQLGLKVQTFREDLDMLIWEMNSLAQAYEGLGIESSTDFFNAANTIFDSVKKGVDALAALMTYEHELMFKTKVDEFKADIGYLIFWMTKLASDMTTTDMGAAQEFWKAAQGIFSGVSKGLDTIGKLRDYPQFGGCFPCWVDMLYQDVGYLLSRLKQLAHDVGYTSLTDAQTFWDKAGEIFIRVNAGLELIGRLRTTSFGVKAKMDEFKQDILDIVGTLAAASDEISEQGLLNKAKWFKSQLAEIAGIMEAGLSTIAGIASFGAEVDVSVIEQFIQALGEGIAQADSLVAQFLQTVESRFAQSAGAFYNLGYSAGSAYATGFADALSPQTYKPPPGAYSGEVASRGYSAQGGGTINNTFQMNVASGMDLAMVRQTVQEAMRRP